MRRIVAAICAALAPTASDAVSLSEDGTGQALIFPYYTARGTFNTYLSVVNHTSRAKAVRVNVREARLGKAVASFNLFLSPNDMWTAAIVPTADGARMVTSDTSCVEPAGGALEFHDRNFSAANADGAGDAPDRVREGYVEMLEMATLTGMSAAAATHTTAGVPANCAVVQPPFAVEVTPPNGGLSGTLTVIDVLRGMDFTVNAEALESLASRPFYRASSDDYPDFNAAEIDPVSVVVTDGHVYRSEWSHPVQAVSAVLMRAPIAEYTLDVTTRSLTDLVFTMPTRRLHGTAGIPAAPFDSAARWSSGCRTVEGDVGSHVRLSFGNRDGRSAIAGGACLLGCLPARLCASAAVASVVNPALPHTTRGRGVLDSATAGVRDASTIPFPGPSGRLSVASSTAFAAGWLEVANEEATMTSRDSSAHIDRTSGASTRGAHTFVGLPFMGFAVRSFHNGTLDCAGQACQGNFGGSFPFKYRRLLSP